MSYSYDIYGKNTATNNCINNPYQYNAEYTDSATGLQYLRARYYNPSTHRFQTKDTYQGTTQTPLTRNTYTYANNNPINFIDPTGHLFEGLFGIVGRGISFYVDGFKGLNNGKGLAGFSNYGERGYISATDVGRQVDYFLKPGSTYGNPTLELEPKDPTPIKKIVNKIKEAKKEVYDWSTTKMGLIIAKAKESSEKSAFCDALESLFDVAVTAYDEIKNAKIGDILDGISLSGFMIWGIKKSEQVTSDRFIHLKNVMNIHTDPKYRIIPLNNLSTMEQFDDYEQHCRNVYDTLNIIAESYNISISNKNFSELSEEEINLLTDRLIIQVWDSDFFSAYVDTNGKEIKDKGVDEAW